MLGESGRASSEPRAHPPTPVEAGSKSCCAHCRTRCIAGLTDRCSGAIIARLSAVGRRRAVPARLSGLDGTSGSYLHPAANVLEQKRSLAEFFDWYNRRRPYQSLGRQTPDEAPPVPGPMPSSPRKDARPLAVPLASGSAPQRVGHPDRKGRIERPYVENNFPGR